MTKIYLVRHGQATSSWGLEKDPGLDELGRAQAQAAAQKLAPLGPLPIIASPRARARETAIPLAKIWDIEPAIEERVGEIRFPSETPADRVHWLKEVMVDQWPNLDPVLQQWRREVIEALLTIETDTVVFTHYSIFDILRFAFPWLGGSLIEFLCNSVNIRGETFLQRIERCLSGRSAG